MLACGFILFGRRAVNNKSGDCYLHMNFAFFSNEDRKLKTMRGMR